MIEKSWTPRGFEVRQHSAGSYQGFRDGRTTIRIICPFCNAKILAYLWSLAGCGKRCDCGVIHYHGFISVDDKNKFGGFNKEEGEKARQEFLKR